ncbi:EPIDERMAL PATTERNING FACTOR-like protein 6 isoform X1 [Populus alba]|uniref:Epidermal patterning factor-like protein n=2 Tax=Populus TaxID=3689 RepID=A0A4U5QEZ1_POPAL|nr:EPIDERMAL PATTERNING FACTOR-like protein 6 isoform X1 [Populus alba]KAG6751395.1 hypothetical protein POTOM_045931 [Populus tomentosa]TKS09084.1 EPIDERMAL PATTERNING FACTOR-like protein 6 isoform X1 [Populus alba]
MELKSKRSLIFFNKEPSLFQCVSFTIFFILSFVALFSTISSKTTCLGIIRCPLSGKARDFYFQEFEKTRGYEGQMEASLSMARRFLSGPGSSPPRCTSKCGKCTPCKPVHVPVPPGTPVTAEYYPEAWRCKCGNKLYMP